MCDVSVRGRLRTPQPDQVHGPVVRFNLQQAFQLKTCGTKLTSKIGKAYIIYVYLFYVVYSVINAWFYVTYGLRAGLKQT